MRQLLYIATIFLAGCISDPSEHAVDVTVPLTGTAAVTVQRQQKKQKKSSAPADKSLLTTLLRDSVSAYDSPLEKMPEPTQSIKVIHHGDYRKIFNDSNYVQWQSAEKYGIRPLSDTRSHWQLTQPLVKVVSCADFYVQPLTYSRPYLVKEGADMLHEIGRRFRDTLQARGGGDYRIKVTSVLRTPESVARLRRNNRNAVDSSTHQFATTIDISYACL